MVPTMLAYGWRTRCSGFGLLIAVAKPMGTAGELEPMSFDELWDALLPVGREPSTGGYRRYAWTAADLECREWFTSAAGERGLAVETDRNGNLWAWWGDPTAADALVLGSHLDSVPGGGAFDGPLGVVSAFATLDAVRAQGIEPARPVALVAFADEEGARFGVACAGSRLLTGALAANQALALRDGDGTTMAEAMRAAGHDPAGVGAEPERVARIGCLVELHIEQGRARPDSYGAATPMTDDPHGLVDLDRAVGVASSIWPHGRWRLDFSGRADHAGTTRLVDRDDPMLAYAAMVLAAREAAEKHRALATFGKVRVEPNGVNAIPSHVTAWLDARGADEDRVRAVVAELSARTSRLPAETRQPNLTSPGAPDLSGTASAPPAEARSWTLTGRGKPPLRITAESWTPSTLFDAGLRDRLAALLDGAPVLPTGAGHDAGILAAAGVPSAMLFVRNRTGVSHSPAEHADRADCLAGVDSLARVLVDVGES
jgi:N-carbamoyl-L-amino-acid hydrolase